jgi:hypothetical protein
MSVRVTLRKLREAVGRATILVLGWFPMTIVLDREEPMAEFCWRRLLEVAESGGAMSGDKATSNVDKSSVAYRSLQMAKLYKALGPRVVALLRVGNRVDALAGQFELEPVYINAAGLKWLRAAEALIVSEERENVSLDELTLAFEATHEPLEDGWCERGQAGFWESPMYSPRKPFFNVA